MKCCKGAEPYTIEKCLNPEFLKQESFYLKISQRSLKIDHMHTPPHPLALSGTNTSSG